MENKKQINTDTIEGMKIYFNQAATVQLIQKTAGYQFVKRADGVMMQYRNGNHTFYRTYDGFCKAALHSYKRG